MISSFGEYFVEVVCEPIPASAQNCSLFEPITKVLSSYEGIQMEGIECGISPNRIFFVVPKVPSSLKRKADLIRGPATNTPYAFVERFVEKYSQYSTELFKENVGDKEFWSLKVEYPEQPAHFALQKITIDILSEVKWPEYMRWGAKIAWIRPIRRLFAMFMDSPLLFSWHDAGIMSSPSSVLSSTSQGEFMFDSYEKYIQYLQHHYIFPNYEQRYKFIKSQADTLSKSLGLAMQDASYKMLDELCSSSESPILYPASVESYYDLPDPIVQTAMMYHQKYVPLFEQDGSLSKSFLICSNSYLDDEGASLIRDARVCMESRLKDAEFFWLKDTSLKEADYLAMIKAWSVSMLGTLAQQSIRVEFLISRLFPEYAHIKDAPKYLNFDLCMNTIFEFPELHGKIGSIYASKYCNVSRAISSAIEWSVFPKGDTKIPSAAPIEGLILGFCVRLDRIVGLIGKGKMPKGSSDQMGVRRAASELIKLGMKLRPTGGFLGMISHSATLYREQGVDVLPNTAELVIPFMKERLVHELEGLLSIENADAFVGKDIDWMETERIKVFLALEEEDTSFLLAFYKRLSGVVATDFSTNFGVAELRRGELPSIEMVSFDTPAEHLQEVLELFKKTESFLDQVYLKDLAPEARETALAFLGSLKSLADNYADFAKLQAVLY